MSALLLVALVTVGTRAAYNAKERSRAATALKRIQSLGHAIQTYINESPGTLESRLMTGGADEWRRLDEGESRWLVDEVARQNNIPDEWRETVMSDAWGRPPRMEVRRAAAGLEFRLMSAGRDSQFDTVDDLRCLTANPSSLATRPPTTQRG